MTADEADVYNPMKYVDDIDLEESTAWIDENLSKDHIIPTMENVVRFRQVQEWFDNKEYQRDNHEEASQALSTVYRIRRGFSQGPKTTPTGMYGI